MAQSTKRKVGLGHAPIEAKQGAHPQQRQHPARAEPLQRMGGEMRVPQLDRQHRQPNQKHEYRAPARPPAPAHCRTAAPDSSSSLRSSRRSSGTCASTPHRRHSESAAPPCAAWPGSASSTSSSTLSLTAGMAADPPVGLALHQQKLAVGRGHALVGVRNLGRRIGQRQFAEHQRHQRPLRQPAHDLARRIAQHARLVPRRLVQRPAQVARLVDRVGIGKQQPFPACLARRGPDGVGLAGPALFQACRP